MVASLIAAPLLGWAVIEGRGRVTEMPQDRLLWGLWLAIILSNLATGWLGGGMVGLTGFAQVVFQYALIRTAVRTMPQLRGALVLLTGFMLFHALSGIQQWNTGVGFGGIEPMTTDGQLRIRSVGIFNDPNDLALSMLVVLPFLFVTVLNAAAGWGVPDRGPGRARADAAGLLLHELARRRPRSRRRPRHHRLASLRVESRPGRGRGHARRRARPRAVAHGGDGRRRGLGARPHPGVVGGPADAQGPADHRRRLRPVHRVPRPGGAQLLRPGARGARAPGRHGLHRHGVLVFRVAAPGRALASNHSTAVPGLAHRLSGDGHGVLRRHLLPVPAIQPGALHGDRARRLLRHPGQGGWRRHVRGVIEGPLAGGRT